LVWLCGECFKERIWGGGWVLVFVGCFIVFGWV